MNENAKRKILMTTTPSQHSRMTCNPRSHALRRTRIYLVQTEIFDRFLNFGTSLTENLQNISNINYIIFNIFFSNAHVRRVERGVGVLLTKERRWGLLGRSRNLISRKYFDWKRNICAYFDWKRKHLTKIWNQKMFLNSSTFTLTFTWLWFGAANNLTAVGSCPRIAAWSEPTSNWRFNNSNFQWMFCVFSIFDT